MVAQEIKARSHCLCCNYDVAGSVLRQAVESLICVCSERQGSFTVLQAPLLYFHNGIWIVGWCDIHCVVLLTSSKAFQSVCGSDSAVLHFCRLVWAPLGQTSLGSLSISSNGSTVLTARWVLMAQPLCALPLKVWTPLRWAEVSVDPNANRCFHIHTQYSMKFNSCSCPFLV